MSDRKEELTQEIKEARREHNAAHWRYVEAEDELGEWALELEQLENELDALLEEEADDEEDHTHG